MTGVDKKRREEGGRGKVISSEPEKQEAFGV